MESCGEIASLCEQSLQAFSQLRGLLCCAGPLRGEIRLMRLMQTGFRQSRSGDRRFSSVEVRRLLECMRELQYAEVLLVAADDLYANRKTFGRESGGY